MRDMSPREAEYAARGVTILALNAFESPDVARAWIAQSGLDLHWGFADEAITEAFGVATVPTQIIVDREGRVAWASSMTSTFGGADTLFEALDGVL